MLCSRSTGTGTQDCSAWQAACGTCFVGPRGRSVDLDDSACGKRTQVVRLQRLQEVFVEVAAAVFD